MSSTYYLMCNAIKPLNAGKAKADMITDYLKCFGEDFNALEAGQRRVLIRGLVKEVVVNSKDDCHVLLNIPLLKGGQKGVGGSPLDEGRPRIYPWMAANRSGGHLSALNGVTDGI